MWRRNAGDAAGRRGCRQRHVTALGCLWALMYYTALLLLEVYQHVPADTGLGSLAARYLGRCGQWITGFSMMFLSTR